MKLVIYIEHMKAVLRTKIKSLWPSGQRSIH